MKNCSKCKVNKSKKEFSKKASNKDGLRYCCKDCSKESIKNWRNKNKKHIENYSKKYQQENRESIKVRKKNYRVKNKEKIKTYNKEYRQENKVHIKIMTKAYRLKNIDKIKKYSKIRGKIYRKNNTEKIKVYLNGYRLENKEKISENQKIRRLKHLEKEPNYNKEYYIDNKEEIKKKVKKYVQENRKIINKRIALRYKNDIQFHLNKKLRTYFKRSLKDNYKKGRMIDYLGMTIAEFKIYLENNFKDWMTWENKGLYNGSFKHGWDIDHIKPLSLFDLTDNEQVKKAWHYSNLQPLCSKINRVIKRDNYEE